MKSVSAPALAAAAALLLAAAPLALADYPAPGAVGFTPGNIAAVRLAHPNVQQIWFSQTAAVWVDEFVAPTSPHAQLVLKQSVPLPNGTSTQPAGQYRLTIQGQDLQNLHDIVHGGIVGLAGDGASIVFGGADALPGTQQSIYQTAQVGTSARARATASKRKCANACAVAIALSTRRARAYATCAHARVIVCARADSGA